jgi:hypothetical protein
MKRLNWIFGLLGLVGVLTSLTFLLGAEPAKSPHSKPTTSCCEEKGCSACCSAMATTTDDHIVQELMTILKETRSPDTFLVTVTVLGRMGPAAKSAIPAIIRNAERLEMLTDVANPEAEGRKEEVAEALMDSMAHILRKPMTGRVKTARATAAASVVYPIPCAPPACIPQPVYIQGDAQPPQPAPSLGVYQAVAPPPTVAPAPVQEILPAPSPVKPPAPKKASKSKVPAPNVSY